MDIYINIYILYHRPLRWPSKIETCCNIKDKTYITFVDGISFLVLTHLLFAAVKPATEWLDKRLPAIARLYGTSETRHSGWATDTVVGVMSVTPVAGTLYSRWAVGVTRSIMTPSTLDTAVNRMNTEQCVLCGRDSFRGRLVLPSASVSVALPHSGQCWSSLTFRRNTLPHRAD